MNWTMSGLMDLATGYWRSQALGAGVELGVFRALAGGALTADEAAARCGADARMTGALLDALCALGVLAASGGRYALEPSAAPFLDPASPCSLEGALRFNADLYPLWGRRAEAVRTGRPAAPPAAHLGADPARTRRFALGMHSRALGLAPHLLPALGVRGDESVLDVGAGPGTFTRLLAERHPALRVVQMDLAPVLAVARELAASSPARDRIGFREGDYHADAPGGPADLVLFCGALHQEDPAAARALLGRLASAVAPGGRLVVVDLMAHPGRQAPAFALLFGLNMMLVSPRARVYGADEVAALLRGAGLADPEVRPVEGIPYVAVSAARSSAARTARPSASPV